MNKLKFITVLLLIFMVSCKNEKKNNVNLEEVSLTKADSTKVALVTQAYLYGYPMMTMDYTHKISSNVVSI